MERMELSSVNVGSLTSAIADIEIYKEPGFSHGIPNYSGYKRHDDATPTSTLTRPSNSHAIRQAESLKSPWRHNQDPYIN